MPRRGENIFKRKDGRWEARYIHHYENGKAKYRYLYGATYTEVRLKRLAELSENGAKQASFKQLATVEQVAGEWLTDVRISVKESTYTRYQRAVTKYILPAFGRMPMAQMDAFRINRYTDELLTGGGLRKGPLSAKTVTDLLCVIKSIGKFGALHGYSCPGLDGVRYPQKAGKQINILSADRRNQLEEALLRSEDTTSLGILFALFTGVRIGELCGLRWGDIDLVNATARIARTVERIANLDPAENAKTKVIISEPKTAHSARVIPIPAFLNEHLRKFRRKAETYVVSGTTSYMEPHGFYRRYKRYLKEHGMPDYTFHAIRHTFATRCVERGFDAKSLAEILGHANVTTTMMFYVHPTLEQKRRQMELLTPQGL